MAFVVDDRNGLSESHPGAGGSAVKARDWLTLEPFRAALLTFSYSQLLRERAASFVTVSVNRSATETRRQVVQGGRGSLVKLLLVFQTRTALVCHSVPSVAQQSVRAHLVPPR